MGKDIFEINDKNPAPFAQPFLVLYFGNGKFWTIDVQGKIDLYLENYTAVKDAFMAMSFEEREAKSLPSMPCNVFGECSDWTNQATPLLKEMLARLEKIGLVPHRIYGYQGSAGPNYVLLHGVLFERVYAEKFGNAQRPANEDIDASRLVPKILAKA